MFGSATKPLEDPSAFDIRPKQISAFEPSALQAVERWQTWVKPRRRGACSRLP